MQTLVSIISRQLNKSVPKFSIPTFLPSMVFGLNSKIIKLKIIEKAALTFEKWLSEDVYIADKIRREYGFVPQTSIDEAVERQCEWFIKSKQDLTENNPK